MPALTKKQSAKKANKRYPPKNQVTSCPICKKLVALATLAAHMGRGDCK